MINHRFYLYFDTTAIQTVVNSFTDYIQFVNNTKKLGDIIMYFVDIFQGLCNVDLSMI